MCAQCPDFTLPGFTQGIEKNKKEERCGGGRGVMVVVNNIEGQ